MISLFLIFTVAQNACNFWDIILTWFCCWWFDQISRGCNELLHYSTTKCSRSFWGKDKDLDMGKLMTMGKAKESYISNYHTKSLFINNKHIIKERVIFEMKKKKKKCSRCQHWSNHVVPTSPFFSLCQFVTDVFQQLYGYGIPSVGHGCKRNKPTLSLVLSLLMLK